MIILQGISQEELFQKIEEIVSRKLDEKIKTEKPKSFSWLSRKEVAILLKVNVVTVHNWTRDGLLSSYRIKSRIYYKSNEVESAVVKRRFSWKDA